MKRQLAIILFVMLLSGGGALNAQKAETSMRTEVFFAKTVVHLCDGSVLYGFLAGLEPDALVIRKGPDDVRLSPKDIAKVIVSADKRRGQFMTIGGLAGIYLGNFGVGKAKNQPTAFMKSQDASAWGYIYLNATYAAAGMGLGYLASLFEKGEKEFTFDADPSRRQAEWRKFRDFASGTSLPPGRVRASVQMALVFPSAAGRYRDSFSKAGYSVSSGYYLSASGNEEYFDPAGRINLLRGVRLTWVVKPRFEVGAAVLFLGEPTVGGYQYSYSYSDPYSYWSRSRQTSARFDSTGCFIVSSFDVLAGRSAKSARWLVGLGAGAARVDFELNLTQTTSTSTYDTDSAGYSFAKSLFCPLLFTELQVPITGSLSIGICADYVPARSQSIPAFPDWDIPAQKIRLGNASAGASLGLRF